MTTIEDNATNLYVNNTLSDVTLHPTNGTVMSHPLEIIVVENEAERWGFTLLMAVIILLSVPSNLSVLYVICRHHKFYYEHMYIIASYAIMDIVMVTVVMPSTIVILFIEHDFPQWLCSAKSVIGIGLLFSSDYMVSLLAVERYVYFCKPYHYHKIFTLKKIVAYVMFIVTFPLAYTVGTEIAIGRIMYFSVMDCQLKQAGLHGYYQVALFFAPPILLTSYSLTNIVMLIIRQRNSVLPAVTSPNPIAQTSQSMTTNRQASYEKKSTPKKALRLLLLVSGTFYLTFLPAEAARTALFNSGLTWAEAETRQDRSAAFQLRMQSLSYYGISPMINPLVYYSTMRELRRSLFRLLCKNRRQSEEQTTQNSVETEQV